MHTRLSPQVGAAEGNSSELDPTAKSTESPHRSHSATRAPFPYLDRLSDGRCSKAHTQGWRFSPVGCRRQLPVCPFRSGKRVAAAGRREQPVDVSRALKVDINDRDSRRLCHGYRSPGVRRWTGCSFPCRSSERRTAVTRLTAECATNSYRAWVVPWSSRP